MLIPAEVYHKYDTIVYPKTTKVSPTLRERFTAALMFWKRSSNDEEEFIPLDLLKMNVLCLNFYLEKYKTLVCHGSFQEGHDIIGLVNEISHIFESLSRFRIHSGMAMMAQVPNLNDFREVRYVHDIVCVWLAESYNMVSMLST